MKLKTAFFDAQIVPPLIDELLIKLIIPWTSCTVFPAIKIAPPRPPMYFAELFRKLLVPLKQSTVVPDVEIAPLP